MFNSNPVIFISNSPYAKYLASQFSQCVTPFDVDKKNKLIFKKEGRPIGYVILKGSVSVHRLHDDLTIDFLEAPSLIGLANLLSGPLDIYLRPTGAARVATLTQAQAYEIIRANNLWELIAHHIAHQLNWLYSHSTHLTAPTAYEIIRFQLLKLMTETQPVRDDVTVERYIRDKTNLSRSGIMRVLSELRKGGYIEMENGRLTGIKHLPEKY
ncbi:helix-turn-helix domain-containing protein [Franconibacter helveticus]|uniref:winged helix-turn-helix transcriptional regulator n=1 Tax=Franconibacter helveticus TaxID=357240 RepID=UPI0029153474|nr:helix-turn-helix domain-containing protein [Franconibacter helveticus]MDU6924389.1 helix-turn-helix domain-containing protein [Franconibacter helveticus]